MEEMENKGFKALSDIFKALGFPIRVEILKILEKNPLRYSELMRTVRLDRFNDAGKFAYHLSKLMENGLVEYKPENKIYSITMLGKDVLNLAMSLFESLRRKENILLVRRTDSSIELFERKRIEECLVREAGMEQETAETIALEIEERLYSMGVKYLTAPLIREYVNAILLEKKMENYRHRLTRLGIPVHDVSELISLKRSVNDVVNEAGEEVMRQYAFLIKLPREIGDAHLSGIVNINHLANFMFKPDEPISSLTSLSLLKTHSFIPVSGSPSSFKHVMWRLVDELNNSSLDANSIIIDADDIEFFKELLLSTAISRGKWNIVLTTEYEPLMLELLKELEKMADKIVLSNISLSLVEYGKKVFEEEIGDKIARYLGAGGALVLSNSSNMIPTHHFSILRGHAEDYIRAGILGSISLNLPLILEKASFDIDVFWEALDETVSRIMEAFKLKRESLKNIVDNRKIPPLSNTVNGDAYFIVERGLTVIELTGLYDAAEKISSSREISDTVSEAEKIFKKVSENASKNSGKNHRSIISLISHGEAVRRFRRELKTVNEEERINLVPRNLPFEEWFKLESRLKSLTPESSIILLRNFEELKSLKRNDKVSVLIHNPATMCASCGKIYPATEENCTCGSCSRSFP
ncbi:MAG: ArsR family transcriptional regulator [Thermoproteota archaeon]